MSQINYAIFIWLDTKILIFILETYSP